ncbi:MAG: hypothetical protein MZU95_07625 [Desulfomicrobium escambiense]|nr:hypothetical protein [Desulfomicrobium escambiense]
MPAPEKIDELDQEDLEGFTVFPRASTPPSCGNIPVVVRSPDIDHEIESAIELFLVIGDIRSEVSRYPVASDQNPVLVVSEPSS